MSNRGASLRTKYRVMAGGLILLAICVTSCRKAVQSGASVSNSRPITSPGSYDISDSDWLDAIKIEPVGNDLIITVAAKRARSDKGTSRKTVSHRFEKRAGWAVSVDEKARLVEYR